MIHLLINPFHQPTMLTSPSRGVFPSELNTQAFFAVPRSKLS